MPFIRIPWLALLSSLFIVTSIQAEPVKLSVLSGFSGLYKRPSLVAKQGFLLGVQTEAAEQGIDWKSWAAFEFLDTRLDKARALELAKTAIANGSKAILGFSASGVALNVRDFALDEAKVPFVIFVGGTSAKLRRQHPLFLRLSNDSRYYMISLASWLKTNPPESAGKPKWACIYADYAFGVGVCDAFKQAYQDTGEEIGRVPVPFKTVNKKKEIAQLAKLEPDFAVAAFAGGEAQVFMRDYFRFKVNKTIPLLINASAFSGPLMQKHVETLEKYDTGTGVMYAKPYIPTLKNEANQYFIEHYQQAYNTAPDLFALRGYDTGRLLIKALAKLQGKWDGAQVVKLMKTLPYISPRHGQQLTFDSHGDAINAGYIIKTKRDGAQLVEEMIGQVPPISLDDYQ